MRGNRRAASALYTGCTKQRRDEPNDSDSELFFENASEADGVQQAAEDEGNQHCPGKHGPVIFQTVALQVQGERENKAKRVAAQKSSKLDGQRDVGAKSSRNTESGEHKAKNEEHS